MTAARSGSNGSPATDAASSRPRSAALSEPSSSASDAATAGGTPAAPSVLERGRPSGPLGRAGELLEVERVPAAVPVGVARSACVEVAEQLGRLGLAERSQRDAPRGRHRERAREQPGLLPGPEAEREEDRRRGSTPHEGREELDRRGVAPVQVVEHEDERPLRGEEPEQAADGPVRPVALVGERGRARVAGAAQGREDAGELREELCVPVAVQPEVLRGDVRVERIRPDAERQLALELRRRAREDQAAPVLGTAPQLGEQARLADPGLALDGEAGGASPVQRVERQLELCELVVAPHGRPGGGVDGHLDATLLRSRDCPR